MAHFRECWFITSTMKYKMYLLLLSTLLYHTSYAGNCDIFQNRKNSYSDLSICHYPGTKYNTIEKCVQLCGSMNNCSSIYFGISTYSGDCCLLNNVGPLLVWHGSLTLYHKKTAKLEISRNHHPCSSQWTAPSGWSITGPAIHVDFTNTSCMETFNDASVVNYDLHFHQLLAE